MYPPMERLYALIVTVVVSKRYQPSYPDYYKILGF